jgi:hypothetical protein
MEYWQLFLAFAIAIPVLILWIGCIIDTISRPDLRGWAKALWIFGILLFPLIGSIVYLVVRPRVIVAPESALDETWAGDPSSLPTSQDRGSSFL